MKVMIDKKKETVEGSTPLKHFARHRATSRLLGQQLLRDENAVRQRADVRIRNDDLWRELDVERLLDRERYALRLPLRPEPEVVRVAPVLGCCILVSVLLARQRDERWVRVEAQWHDVHQRLAHGVEVQSARLVHCAVCQ